ncbi:iron-sulfur cluster insertion protein ErpA [Candidatus Woesearchaeota archaeon]|nr:iron-sulfur cluster insertion protein ErpA [Candidatus Woesearchaeota archaeon]
MSSEEVDAVIEKLNAVKAEKPNVHFGKSHDATLVLTDKAAEKLKQLISEQGAVGLRIQVVPGGCSGYQYAFDFEEKPQQDDVIVKQKDITVFVDPESMSMLAGATVDFLDGLHGTGFKITNPNASHSCGCGKSFG